VSTVAEEKKRLRAKLAAAINNFPQEAYQKWGTSQVEAYRQTVKDAQKLATSKKEPSIVQLQSMISTLESYHTRA
jgi:hypothetical protein